MLWWLLASAPHGASMGGIPHKSGQFLPSYGLGCAARLARPVNQPPAALEVLLVLFLSCELKIFPGSAAAFSWSCFLQILSLLYYSTTQY